MGKSGRFLWVLLVDEIQSFLTLVAVLGTSLATIETRTAESLQARLAVVHSGQEYRDLEGQQTLLQAQESALLAQMKAMPSDWVSLNLRVSGELRTLQESETAVGEKMRNLEGQATYGSQSDSPSIFRALGNLVGQTEEKTEVVLLLVLASMVEISAFAMGRKAQVASMAKKSNGRISNPPSDPKDQTNPNTEPKTTGKASESGDLTAEDYLRTALDHPRKPYLLGRGPVSEKLGISEARAKEFIEELVGNGKVRRESKYFVAV